MGFLGAAADACYRDPGAGGIALVNTGGVARGAQLVGATTTLKLAPLAIFILAGASASASWVLARRGVAMSGTPLNFRFLGAAAVVGICSMLALIALGSFQEIIGLATLIGLSAWQVEGRGRLAANVSASLIALFGALILWLVVCAIVLGRANGGGGCRLRGRRRGLQQKNGNDRGKNDC